MIESNPNKLVERYTADLDRMRIPRRTPEGDVGAVDHSSARLLLEGAIREAWCQGGAYGQAIAAQPRTIVLKPSLNSEAFEELVDNTIRNVLREQGGDL